MPGTSTIVTAIEGILNQLLDATGASRGTLRADDSTRGWRSNVPCAEVLRHGAPTMRHDDTLNHRATETIQWIARTRSILKQDDLANISSRPPRALMEIYLAKAQMVGPIFRDGELYGWVSAHDIRGPRPWTAADEEAMTIAVRAVANLLD
jgi:GAF domain-containing protein